MAPSVHVVSRSDLLSSPELISDPLAPHGLAIASSHFDSHDHDHLQPPTIGSTDVDPRHRPSRSGPPFRARLGSHPFTTSMGPTRRACARHQNKASTKTFWKHVKLDGERTK